MQNNYAYGSLAPFLDVASLTLPVDWAKIFGNKHPLEVEIGFGTGEYIAAAASRDPASNFIGFEQDAKRIIKTLRKVHRAGLLNVRLMKLDAVLGLEHLFSPELIRKVHCLFPCPWPKKRHAKHRLFQPGVLSLIHSRLARGGQLLIVTDHKPYADWIAENFSPETFRLERQKIPARFDTKFERKWRSAGQEEFYELILTKMDSAVTGQREIKPMKAYFLDNFVAEKIELPEQSGPVSIQFSDFLYDAERKKAMAHAVVTEDRKSQHVWIMIIHTSKGWCISPADGAAFLPTEGAQKAVELLYEAALRTG